jgi:hypothetical protein
MHTCSATTPEALGGQEASASSCFQAWRLGAVEFEAFWALSGLQGEACSGYVRPFKVLANIGPKNLSYRLELPEHVRMQKVFHVSALKAYHSDGSYQPPPLLKLVDSELKYEVIALRALALRVSNACTWSIA